jgi:hypothetical protein
MSVNFSNFESEFINYTPRWFGRIEESGSWQENIEDELFSKAEQQKGWGYRYRVRIFGFHTGDGVDLPADQLVMANVVMPITAGSGLGGFHDTPAISAGTIVTGYFIDGLSGQEPYIDGILINSNNEVPKKPPEGKTGRFQLSNDTYKEGPPETGAFVPTYFIGTQSYWKNIQSIGDKLHLGDGAVKSWYEQKYDFYKPEPLQSPCKKDNSPMKGIQKTIQNLLNDIQNYDSIAEIFGGGDPKREQFIEKLLDVASGDIAGYMKTIFQDIRGYAYNFLQEEAKKRIPFLFPSEVPDFTNNVNRGNNVLSCLFNKLVRQLPGLIRDLLANLLDKAISIPLCFVENLLNDLLSGAGGILNQITGAVKTAISLFSQAVSVINDVGNFLFNSLDFISGILNFFKCDDDAECPQIQEINLAGTFSPGGDPPISFSDALKVGNLTSFRGLDPQTINYSTAFGS